VVAVVKHNRVKNGYKYIIALFPVCYVDQGHDGPDMYYEECKEICIPKERGNLRFLVVDVIFE
jgi:hypothetical protein